MTPEQLKLVAKARRRRAEAEEGVPDEPQELPLSPGEKIAGARSELMNTASFGMADPIYDAFSTAKQYLTSDEPDTPDQTKLQKAFVDQWGSRKREREEFRRRSEAEGSYVPLASSIAGSIVNPAAMKLTPWMSRAKSLPGMMGRGSLLGGGQAGLQAAGAGGDLGEITKQTSYGAAGGLIAPAAVKGLQKLWEGGGNLIARLRPEMQESGAARKVMQAIMDDMIVANPDMNADQALVLASKRLQELGPRAALMDLGPNSRALASAVYDVPGAAKTEIESFVRPRHEGEGLFGGGGQADALRTELDKIIPESYLATKAGLKGSPTVSKHYEDAFAGNPAMQSNEIDEILRHKYGRRALLKAVDNMRAEGKTVSVYDKEATAQHLEGGGRGKVGVGLKLEILNEVKKAFGKMEEKSYIPDEFGGLKPGPDTEAFKQLRQRLTNQLIKLDMTGSYKLALGESQDVILNRLAMQKGRQFMGGRQTTEELGENLQKMGPSERHHYRVGAKRDLQKRLDDMSQGGDATKRVMPSRTIYEKTERAMGDYDDFMKWKQAGAAEKELAKGYHEVLGGPKTSRNIAAQQSGAVDPNRTLQGLSSINLVNPTTWVTGPYQAVKGLGDSMSMLRNPGLNRRLGQLLTGQDLGDMQKMFQLKTMGDLRTKQLIEAITRGQAGYQY